MYKHFVNGQITAPTNFIAISRYAPFVTFLTSRSFTILIVALAFVLSAPAPASAAVITVNSNCSLANAIRAANLDRAIGGCPAGNGSDTIKLSGMIELQANLPAITAPVRIIGPPTDRAIVDGQSRHSIFIVKGAYAGFRNLVLRNGFREQGGALMIENGGSSLVYNVLFRNNRTPLTGDNHGGAIAHDGRGTLNISRSEFTGNDSSFGGAISTNGNFVGSDLVFRDNTASQDGGALYALLINGNRNATLSKVVFEENSAGHSGGAIWLGEGNMNARRATFYYNRSEYGGAIAIRDDGQLEASWATFEGNVGEIFGGAVDIGSRSASFHNVSFRKNIGSVAVINLWMGTGSVEINCLLELRDNSPNELVDQWVNVTSDSCPDSATAEATSTPIPPTLTPTSAPINTDTATPEQPTLVPPANLAVSASGLITWSEVPGIVYYRLEHYDDKFTDKWRSVHFPYDLPADVTSYQLTNLASSSLSRERGDFSTYRIRIRSVGADGYSAPSEEVSGSLNPNRIPDPDLILPRPGRVSVQWEGGRDAVVRFDPVPGADNYTVSLTYYDDAGEWAFAFLSSPFHRGVRLPTNLTEILFPWDARPDFVTYRLRITASNHLGQWSPVYILDGKVGEDVEVIQPSATPISPTPTETVTPSNTPSSTPTDTDTATATHTPSSTPSATDTATASHTPSSTPTATDTATASHTPSSTPTATDTATETHTPSSAGTPLPPTPIPPTAGPPTLEPPTPASEQMTRAITIVIAITVPVSVTLSLGLTFAFGKLSGRRRRRKQHE